MADTEKNDVNKVKGDTESEAGGHPGEGTAWPNWFAAFRKQRSHPEALLQHKSLGPISEFLIQEYLDALENLHL